MPQEWTQLFIKETDQIAHVYCKKLAYNNQYLIVYQHTNPYTATAIETQEIIQCNITDGLYMFAAQIIEMNINVTCEFQNGILVTPQIRTNLCKQFKPFWCKNIEDAQQKALRLSSRWFTSYNQKQQHTHRKIQIDQTALVDAETPIDALPLNTRLSNAFRRNQIQYIGDLLTYTRSELLKMSNLGASSVSKLEQILANYNIKLYNETE